MDRFLALVYEALPDERPEHARDGRLIAEVHREVRIRPVAENTEALELCAHRADEPLGVLAARLDFSVEVHRGPARKRLRLGGRQARLHRNIGAREVDGVFPLRHGYPTIL